MLSLSTCLFALLLIFGCTGASALEAGKPAPGLEIAMLDGKVFKSAEARGEVIVINLWATWCTFCREEMPALETYYQRHKDEGLRLIAVSMDDVGDETKMREIIKAYSFPGGVGHASKLKALAASGACQ